MLSAIEEMNFIIHLFNRGANAFIKTSDELEFFISAINKVHENEYFYSKYPVPKVRPSEKDWDRYGFIGEVILSHREIEFMRYASSQLLYTQIADKMHVSINTINNYSEAVFRKCDIKSRH